MLIPTEIKDVEVPALLTQFLSITGSSVWDKRIASLRIQGQQNQLSIELLAERHWIELALGSILTRKRLMRSYNKPQNDHQLRLFAFVGAVARCYAQASETGKRRIKGMLLDGLKAPTGLLPFYFEMEIAMQLAQQGFQIELADIENFGRFDFLAQRDGIAMEIECKVVTADLGRQIHKSALIGLGHVLKDTLASWCNKNVTGCYLEVTIPARLHKSSDYQTAIAAAIGHALDVQEPLYNCDYCEVRKRFFNPARPDEYPIDESNSSKLLMVRRPAAILIVFRSRKLDALLNGLYRQLRDSCSRQFSGDRAACLHVRFLDLTEAEFLDIAQAQSKEPKETTGLHLMTHELLNRRPNLHSIIYTSFGSMRTAPTEVAGDRVVVTSENIPAYYFINSQNAFSADARYNFRGIKSVHLRA